MSLLHLAASGLILHAPPNLPIDPAVIIRIEMLLAHTPLVGRL